MIRVLRRIFFSHAGLKASALLISVGLWVAYTSEPVVEAGYSAPLLMVNLPAGLKISGEVPSAVLLRVRGRLNRLRTFQSGEMSVRADCSQTRPGTQTVYLGPNMVRVPYGAEIVGITPPEIEISLVPASAPRPQRK
jgi:hypothetical protein